MAISQPELRQAVIQILQTHDLQKITLRMVMGMLVDKLEVEATQLAGQKKKVREIINEFLQTTYDPNEDVAAASAVGAEEQRAKSRKRKAEGGGGGGGGSGGGGEKKVKLTGLEKAVVLAEPLASFFGMNVIPRSLIPKRISNYAKENDLQDPKDRRKILCDSRLKEALGVDEFTFFSLTKLVSRLVSKPEEHGADIQEAAQKCEEEHLEEKIRRIGEAAEAAGAGGEAGGKKAKTSEPKEKKPSGLLKPMQLSKELSAVCGESRLSRAEVMKKIWVYIRENELKDPNDKRRVLCDDKLRAVFDGQDSVGNMGMNKFLSAHMTKID